MNVAVGKNLFDDFNRADGAMATSEMGRPIKSSGGIGILLG